MRTALTVRDADGNPKTYEATDDDITMGLCEDILNAFHADLLVGELDGEATDEIARAMIANLSGFYPYAARLFEGITEDEWRSAKVTDCIAVIREVLTYAFGLLSTLLSDGSKAKKAKNRRGTPRPSTKPFSTSSWP